MSEARCATHDAPSTGTCARCGAFGCDHLDGTTRCLNRFLGQSGRAILERVMGLLLVAIAVQFMIGGVREAFPEIFTARS